jgi:uncharacterized damage-inducible protein DinB
MTVEQDFLQCSARSLRQAHGRIETCLGKLDDDQIWRRAGVHSNSCGNLCLHLAGNVTQWILHGVGGAPDRRDRDAEFAAQGGVGRAELAALLHNAVQQACAIIESLPEQSLTEQRCIQNYSVTVLEAIYHVVEHFSQHTGQIIFLTKAITDEDLGFFAHLTGATKSPAPPEERDKP